MEIKVVSITGSNLPDFIFLLNPMKQVICSDFANQLYNIYAMYLDFNRNITSTKFFL